MIMIRTYMLSISMILCFAGIQAMDPNTNREIIERLASDIRNDNIVGVQTMLERNPELAHAHSSNDWYAYPMLMFALTGEKDHLEMVTLLLKYKPDVNARNKYGDTVLMKAAFCGRRESVKLLLEVGADTNLKGDFGDTALIATIRRNKEHLEIIQQLLDHNANIDEQGYNGETALMKAAADLSRWGKQKTITLLLESGADPTIRDNEGETAADISRSQGNEDLAKFIENYQFGKNIKGE